MGHGSPDKAKSRSWDIQEIPQQDHGGFCSPSVNGFGTHKYFEAILRLLNDSVFLGGRVDF